MAYEERRKTDILPLAVGGALLLLAVKYVAQPPEEKVSAEIVEIEVD